MRNSVTRFMLGCGDQVISDEKLLGTSSRISALGFFIHAVIDLLWQQKQLDLEMYQSTHEECYHQSFGNKPFLRSLEDL